MGKRKAEEAGLPARIEQQPASTSGAGPFVVYFPSRFEPNSGDTACEWQAYAHSERRNQYQLVARTVSQSRRGLGEAPRPWCPCRRRRRRLPPPDLGGPPQTANPCLLRLTYTCRSGRWTLWAAPPARSIAARYHAGGLLCTLSIACCVCYACRMLLCSARCIGSSIQQ